nr:tumor protein D54 [Plectrocnemia conspersa]
MIMDAEGERYAFKLIDSENNTVYSLSENDTEPLSVEYIEDPYFVRLDSDATPSLDEPEAGSWSLSNQPIPDDLSNDDSLLCVEAEFIMDNRKRRLRIFRKKMRDVRVHFQDFSKPYLAKISSQNNYKMFLGLTDNSVETTPVSPSEEATPELLGLTPEQVELQKAEWTQELNLVEEEIATLRFVLASKIKISSELKRKLGISVWKEFTEDMNQGIKNVKESTVYQKTESVIKTTAEKTSSIFGGITGGITSKLGQMRNSESFRSIEEKVGSAYENVKGKVASRSNSMQGFEEGRRDSTRVTPATSPTIPEYKGLE